MKLGRRKPWLFMAAVTGMLAMTLAVLYVNGALYNDLDHVQGIGNLRHIKQLDAQWQSDVLKSRMGIDSNYDSLVGSAGEQFNLLDESATALRANADVGGQQLLKNHDALRQAIDDKAALIERFKSANALLRNSLVFLPTAANDAQMAIERMAEAPAAARAAKVRAQANVTALLLACLLYSQNASDDGKAELRSWLASAETDKSRLPPVVVEKVDLLVAHAKTVEREQDELNRLIAAIGAVPTAARIEDVAGAMIRNQLQAAAKSRVYRQLLSGFAALLLVLLLYAAIRLVRSRETLEASRDQLFEYGQSLESKVADRVSALRESEEKMARLARYDSLTGLPNRNLFRDRLAAAMKKVDGTDLSVVLMFIDLDHFKQINDSRGHVVGDAVLQVVAQRLLQIVGKGDTVARLGGDEFTVVLEGVSSVAQAAVAAAKIKSALATPLAVSDREFTVSASVGVALYPADAADADTLLQAADIAMYRAKEEGRNAHSLFVPEMALQINERVTMGSLLRHALDRGEFELHYQPKVELASGRVVGAEALLRWNSEELGLVSPARFIPIAEEIGLIVEIGDWVLRMACKQAAAWSRAGLPALVMAVNLSPRQLRDAGLIQRIALALNESRLPADRLELELTEGVIMENVKGHVQTLTAIRGLGVRLAVDDFGTGYSSLAYLARLPINTLKIDRVFISTMLEVSNVMTLVSTIVTLAHSLRLSVVAEGVETIGQYRALATLHCDEIQGHYCSSPAVAATIEALIRRNQKNALPTDPIAGSARTPADSVLADLATG